MQQQPASAAMKAAVTGFTEAARTMGQIVSKPRPEDMSVGKPEPCAHLAKTSMIGTSTLNGYAGTLDPAYPYPTLLKAARQSPAVVTATAPDEQ